MSNYVLFGHSGSLNRGCEAIIKTTSRFIKELSTANTTTLVSFEPDEDTELKDIDIITRFQPEELKLFSKDYIVSVLINRLTGSESFSIGKQYKKTLEATKNADVCVSIGGDNYCYGDLNVFYEIDRRIRKQGKKLILWGASVGQEDLTEQKIKDFKMFDLVVTRESITYNLFKDNKLNSNVKLYPDPAFTLETEFPELPTKWDMNEVIGINVSPLVCNRNSSVKSATMTLIDYILKNTKYSVALLSHVMKPHDNDYTLMEKIFVHFSGVYGDNRLFLIDKKYNASQLKGIIAKTKMFIGARTHATIAAYSSCVPTMVLGYSVKSRGIAKDIFNCEKFVINTSTLKDDKQLINDFCEFDEQHKEIRSYLTERMPEIISKSKEASKELML